MITWESTAGCAPQFALTHPAFPAASNLHVVSHDLPHAGAECSPASSARRLENSVERHDSGETRKTDRAYERSRESGLDFVLRCAVEIFFLATGFKKRALKPDHFMVWLIVLAASVAEKLYALWALCRPISIG